MKIGLDLGNTIVDRSNNNVPFEYAFETIKWFKDEVFDDVFIVSRVNSEQRERSLKWLSDHCFYDLTGVPESNVYYCFDRRDKAVFVKGLGISVFIDDRIDVLTAMSDDVIKILYSNDENSIKLANNYGIYVCKNWKEVGYLILISPRKL